MSVQVRRNFNPNNTGQVHRNGKLPLRNGSQAWEYDLRLQSDTGRCTIRETEGSDTPLDLAWHAPVQNARITPKLRATSRWLLWVDVIFAVWAAELVVRIVENFALWE